MRGHLDTSLFDTKDVLMMELIISISIHEAWFETISDPSPPKLPFTTIFIDSNFKMILW